jgi:hypothetical protein
LENFGELSCELVSERERERELCFFLVRGFWVSLLLVVRRRWRREKETKSFSFQWKLLESVLSRGSRKEKEILQANFGRRV